MLNGLARWRVWMETSGERRHLCEESLLLARETGEDGMASMAEVNLALIAMHEGEYGRATALRRHSA